MKSRHIGTETKDDFCIKNRFQFPEEWFGTPLYTNMAAISLFWNTNMTAVTSSENVLYLLLWDLIKKKLIVLSKENLEKVSSSLSLTLIIINFLFQ